jgi:hypothetical protein
VAQQSIEKTDFRNATTAMTQPVVAKTEAGKPSLVVVIAYNRSVKIRVSGKGIRNG